MYHLLVYRSTNRSRKRISILVRKSLESRNSPIISNELFRNLIKLKCGDSGSNMLSDLAKCLTYQLISLTHQLNLFICL